RLLDGGIVDSIPYRFMKDKGYDRYLVILTQPADFRKSENKLLPLMKIVYRKYPRFVEAMRTRHIRYNQQVDEVREDEKKGITMVICPDESLNIGKTEKDTAEIDRVYEIGRKLAYRKLDEIKKFLGE
ncbi:MAG: patatin family protein, partial [Erysipelotrichaceae bacterium]|nr:patatin family protein [Erysipelotrichaceae bacterium]